MQLAHYLELLRSGQLDLARALREVADAYDDEADVHYTAVLCASWCEEGAEALDGACERYAPDAPAPPEELHSDLFHGPRSGGIGMLRDLQDLHRMAADVDLTWTLVGQAAKGNRDGDLDAVVREHQRQTARVLQWLTTVLKTSAVQALVVA